MSRIRNIFSIFIGVLLICIVYCTNTRKEAEDDVQFSSREVNAIWCYYESNFIKKRILAMDGSGKVLDTNICFINHGVRIDTTSIGDTLEITVNAQYNDSGSLCAPRGGMTFNVFGFFPHSDTVNYRNDWDYIMINRTADFDTCLQPWMNVLPLATQKPAFIKFLKANKSSLNDWLYKESQKRGYITEND